MKLIKGEFKEMLKGWGSPPSAGLFVRPARTYSNR